MAPFSFHGMVAFRLVKVMAYIHIILKCQYFLTEIRSLQLFLFKEEKLFQLYIEQCRLVH